MGLRNILTPTNPQQTSNGNTLGGGILSLFEPGTTTFIQAFKDSSLAVPHATPIILSGSGRAEVWINLDCDLQLTDRNGNLILFQENANPEGLGATATGSLLTNGSFEDDTNADGTPDAWVLVNEAGSTNARDISESTDGAASFRFTSAGTGGGNLTSENFFPTNDVDDLRVTFDLRSTVAAVRNIFRVEWYDVSQVSISDSDPYDSTANPAVFTGFTFDVTPPALARFAKIKIIGIDPSVALAGSTFVDNVAALYPAIVSGVFDNIEVRNNEIISLNLNGEIDIKPNGTGPINMISSNAVDLVDSANPVNIGQVVPAVSNPHIAADANQIQAKADATNSADLFINLLGGNVSLAAAALVIDAAGGNMTLGNGVGSPDLFMNGGATGQPLLGFNQGGVNRAFIQYLNGSTNLVIDTVGAGRDIELRPNDVQALLAADGGLVTVANGLTVTASDIIASAGRLYLAEVAAGAEIANHGQLYVNASNDLIYRDEAGAETNLLTAGGTVNISGTPVNNQVTIWTAADTIEGQVGLTFTGTGGTGGILSVLGADAKLQMQDSLATVSTMEITNNRTNAIAARFTKNVANATAPVVIIHNSQVTGSDVDASGLEIDNEQGPALNIVRGEIDLQDSVPNSSHAILATYGSMYCRAPVGGSGFGGFNQPVWRDGNLNELVMLGIKEDLEQAFTSGADRTFANRHDSNKLITISLDRVSNSSLGNIRIRVGDATGGTDTAGYVGRAWATSTAGAVTTATFTDGWNIQMQSATSVLTGTATLKRMGREGLDEWVITGTFIEEDGASSFRHELWGRRVMSSQIDRVVLNTAAGTWDAGDGQVLWQA